MNQQSAMISIEPEELRPPTPLMSYEKNIFTPVYYKVKKGDTIFRILKIYFPRDSAEIIRHNGIHSNVIKEGNQFLIGYYPTYLLEKKEDLWAENLVEFPGKPGKELVTLSGPAKTFDPPLDKLPYPFVLSNKIPELSVVEIGNPMSGNTIKAKVIGKIPPGKYPLDILLLLSKKDAISLGFLDAKFFVSAKYYK